MEISIPWAAFCNKRLAKVIIPHSLINSDSFELPKASEAICNHTQLQFVTQSIIDQYAPPWPVRLRDGELRFADSRKRPVNLQGLFENLNSEIIATQQFTVSEAG